LNKLGLTYCEIWRESKTLFGCVSLVWVSQSLNSLRPAVAMQAVD